MQLEFSDRGLSLEISDDGVGFDIEAARLTPGLGLISMRERIHLIGGEFNIASSPGNGTRIMARVPILRALIKISYPKAAMLLIDGCADRSS